jgi:hypothetical protein
MKLIYIIIFIDEAPDGVFLESGFNNILDAATYHPMASVRYKISNIYLVDFEKCLSLL